MIKVIEKLKSKAQKIDAYCNQNKDLIIHVDYRDFNWPRKEDGSILEYKELRPDSFFGRFVLTVEGMSHFDCAILGDGKLKVQYNCYDKSPPYWIENIHFKHPRYRLGKIISFRTFSKICKRFALTYENRIRARENQNNLCSDKFNLTQKCIDHLLKQARKTFP